MSANRPVTLSALYIYPVKSCRGIALTEALLTPRGLEHDREWMVVDAAGKFLTQRQLPRMALIETRLTPDALELSAAGQGRVRVPLKAPLEKRVPVQVWRHECEAFHAGDAAEQWLTKSLGQPARLVRFDPAHRRLSNRDWTGGLAAENRFSDGYPVLVLSEESLAELNRRMGAPEPLGMDRFRPNVVFRGATPHAEDAASALTTQDIELRLVKPCTRCPITATNQLTAEVGKEPLRTLATYRRDEKLGGVTFGLNAIVARGMGARLRVGMPLTLLP
jgi:uncharacterized protein YcbX